ncbi:MAG: aminopeptidase [Desulfobacterales bacterium]|nr:aminopeptidase [Desulfobacterales bacterium]
MIKQINKAEAEKLSKTVLREPTLVWDALNQVQKKSAFKFAEDYKKFIDNSKTERESVKEIEKILLKSGFKNIDSVTKGKSVSKFYKIYNKKAVAVAYCGKRDISKGVNIIGSHIDSPRLDLKQNPLYEEQDIALMKTHYYGGIKKYQWLARPLAIHGIAYLKDGKEVTITIGEKESDPVFSISDLLPHLGKDQASKKLSDAFEGEKLNIVTGSLPIGDKEIKERFKLTILNILYTDFKITEEDLLCAEIEVVPAGKSRDVGFDRSLVGAYGHDDRVCAYTSLRAIIDLKKIPEVTAVGFFFDKEEIGSEGNTGAKSKIIDDFISDLLVIKKEDSSQRSLRKAIISSSALSGDVNAGIEPDYQSVHEKRNAARIGYGICFSKFTGVRGKSGSSDANSEYFNKIRKIFNRDKIVWQVAELGKVDQGGGGTVAKFLAEYGMEIIDCGPAVLSMHSPFELCGKADIYMAYLAYNTFYKDMI